MSATESTEAPVPRRSFVRSVSLLVGGTAVSQALTVLTAPLLTRLYAPDDFGLLGGFVSLVATLGAFLTLRYSLAIPLPESDDDAAHLAILSLVIAGAIVVAVSVALWSFGDDAMRFLNLTGLVPHMWLIPVALAFVALSDVFTYWAIRLNTFGIVTRTTVARGLASLATQLLASPLAAQGLVLGNVAGAVAGSFSLTRAGLSSPRGARLLRPVPAEVRRLAKRYRRFPLFSAPAGLFNTLGVQLPPLLFVSLFNPAAAGQYVIAHRVLSLPMSLLGKALADVFLSRAAEARREDNLGILVSTIHSALARAAMPAVMALMLVGPRLFQLVFGPEWEVAGRMARWMAPWIYLVFVTSPLSSLFSVLEKQAQGAAFQATLLMARIAAIFLGARTGDIVLTVVLFSGASALCWLGFLAWVFRAAGHGGASFVAPTLRAAAVSAAMLLPLGLVVTQNLQGPWLIAGAALSLLLTLAYYGRLARRLLR